MGITRRTAQAPAPQAAPPPPPPPQAQYPAATQGYQQQQQYGNAAQAIEGPNFMDLGFYSGGFLVPQGNYVITNVDVLLYKGDTGTMAEKLGSLVTFVPLADPKPENAKTAFYSYGTDAHKSFMPNPATGKGILPIPGAPAAGFNNSTNWFLFLKSMYDCGLPHGIVTSSVQPIEGTWVYVAHIDEPAERATFQSKTAEVQTGPRTPKKIAVIGEILQGGKPWEGGGGWPAAPVHAGPAPVQHLNGAPAPVAAAPRSLAPPPPPAQPVGMDMADIRGIAMNAIADVLDVAVKNKQNTVPRLGVRNTVFGAVAAKNGEQTAGAVLAQVFDTPGVLETVVGDLGCTINGGMIVLPS